MEFRNRNTGAIVTADEFRAQFPNTSFPQLLTPDILNDFGYDPILEGPQPTLIPPYQYSQLDGIVEVNGQWFTHYIAVTPDAEQKARMDAAQAEGVRTTRNRLLADCDWTQLSDAPVDRALWAAYRQELRDVSNQPGFPWQVVWPEKP